MKDEVRLSIKATKIDVYTDTFKVLIKYDDQYILENVCTDIYRKYVQSIRDTCTRNNLRFSDYIEQISRDDLDIQNIVGKRLKAELDALNKEAETENAVIKFERKLNEAEERKNSHITELREDTEKKISSLKRKLEEIDDRETKKLCEMEGRLTERENTIFKCDNCKFVDCKNGRDVETLSKGMKVRSKIALNCRNLNGEKSGIPENAEGIVAGPFTIFWKLLPRVKTIHKYDLDRGISVAYKCK